MQASACDTARLHKVLKDALILFDELADPGAAHPNHAELVQSQLNGILAAFVSAFSPAPRPAVVFTSAGFRRNTAGYFVNCRPKPRPPPCIDAGAGR